MSEYEVKDFPKLMKKHFGNDKEIIQTSITKFPLSGFGSIMLKIDFTLKNKTDGKEKKMYAVGKILPESEERREFFNIQATFTHEVNFYQSILPMLKAFQIENGVTNTLDMFAHCYGARINLEENSDKVTPDAILVLENLTESGYQNIESAVGFDYDSAKVILQDAAKFHGTIIAFKLKKPKEFEKKLKTNCFTFDFSQEEVKGWLKAPEMIMKENAECAPLAETITAFFKKDIAKARGPYACLTHSDLWVNNTMQKFNNGKIVKNIFVDFQLLNYRSCASDVFFFLWTSVRKSVLEKHIDDLIKFYHDNLISTLVDLHCDVSSFSLEKFYEDIRIEADYEFVHALIFSFGTRIRDSLKVVQEQQETEQKSKDYPEYEMVYKMTPIELKEFVWFMTLECHKRGWVY